MDPDRTSKHSLSDYETSFGSSFREIDNPQPEAPVQSTPHSLSRAVYEKRSEYVTPATIRIKVGSWNVAACSGVEDDLRKWFVDGKGVDVALSGLSIGDKKETVSQENVEIEAGGEERPTAGRSEPVGEEGEVMGGRDIDLYVLGLQEIVSLASAKEYIGRVYVASGPLNVWKKACEKSVPEGYRLVVDTQMSGLLLLIYASAEVAPTISDVSSNCVGTGVMGYLGNKGAVSTRIVLGETTRLVFINAHLASGTDKAHLDRRVWDWNQIITRTRFAPVNKGGVVENQEESIGNEDFCFVCGDLNFRLEGLPGSDIRRLLKLHTEGEFDISMRNTENSSSPVLVHHVDSEDDELEDNTNQRTSSDNYSDLPDPDEFAPDPHNDPTSLQATLDSILSHDQLRRVQRQKKAFHDGWREGPVTFLPTYKYDVGSFATFDSSEKLRPLSWCDRILYRSKHDGEKYEKKVMEAEAARKRDQEMKDRGLDDVARQEEVIFDYDPALDGMNTVNSAKNFDYDYDEYDDTEPTVISAPSTEMQPQHPSQPGTVSQVGEWEDPLHLDIYTSHQHILSSDHKPLSAIFKLSYLSVDPVLKARIHAEVARELDRAENEGRPTITLIVDSPPEPKNEAKHDPSNPAAHWASKPPASGTDAALVVDFGEVRYLQRKSRALTIANTGAVTARFSFIPRPGVDGEEVIKPSWLDFRFIDSYDSSGTAQQVSNEVHLAPGETITATLEVYVQDTAQVRQLNRDELLLDDVLVLRVLEGRDYFVPIRGSWSRTPFGMSIPELIRIPPDGGGAHGLPEKVDMGGAMHFSAPKELFMLTEAIEGLAERAWADKEMISKLSSYTPDGWPFEFTTSANKRLAHENQVIMALEEDRPLMETFSVETSAVERIEVLSEVLILFLGSLEDGIIKVEDWETIDTVLLTHKGAVPSGDCKELVLDVLSGSPNHHISLVFLTSALNKVISERLGGSIDTGGAGSLDGAKLEKRSRKSFRKSIGHVAAQAAAHRHRRTKSGDEERKKEMGKVDEERRKIERRVAEVFAPVVIRDGVRSAKGQEQRKREVIEAFLAQSH